MPIQGASPDAERARLHEAARALEALVLKQLVTASKAFTGGDGAGSAVRADLFADALADAMVKGGGIGLAAQIERTMGGAPLPGPLPRLAPEAREVAPHPSRSPSPSTLTTNPASAFPPAPSSSSLADALFSEAPAATRVTSGFGMRVDPFTGRDAHHAGVDLAQPEGEAIHAVLGGIVRAAGQRGGYGDTIEIDHGGGVTTLYAHASELLVHPGETVTPGQPIARVGHSGRATGSHLHFEVRVAGRAVDPARALKIYQRRAEDPSESGS